MAKKFTFKRQPAATGLAAVADPYPTTDIKFDGKVVGAIDPPSAWNNDDRWSVRFYVKGSPKGNPNCPWHQVRMSTRFESESAAREAILRQAPNILATLNFYPME